MDEQEGSVVLRMTPAEVELVRTALGLLKSTLGREEADELAAVMALLARLDLADDR